MRHEILMAVKVSMLTFWVVTPCELIVRYKRFGRTHYLHIQP
jgi:hypothetical protein